MMANIRQILEQILAILLNIKIYLIAFYPANLHLPWQTRTSIQWMKLRTPENLDRSNKTPEEIAKTYGCHFINCNAELVDDIKEQKAEHTYDGVHLYVNAYLKVYGALGLRKYERISSSYSLFSLDYSTIDVKSEKLKWGIPMWKWFKRFIVLVIVLFFAMVALLIPDKIDSQDQLKNVSTQTSLVDLVQAGIGETSLSSGDLSTEINLDSNQFRQVLRESIAESNDETLQNSTVELNDSYLTAKVPVSLGPIESTFSLDFTVSTNKEVILLDLAGAHLGRLPVPKSLVLPYLKKSIAQSSSGVRVVNDQIQLKLPEIGYEIEQATINNSKMKVKLNIPISLPTSW